MPANSDQLAQAAQTLIERLESGDALRVLQAIQETRKALAEYYRRRHGVAAALNPGGQANAG